MKKVYIYQIVEEQRHPRGHMQYLIQYEGKNGRISGKWVGEYQLRHLYREGRLTGHMSDRIRHEIGRDLSMRKGRPRKKVVEVVEPAPELPKTYSLPDVFEVERPAIQNTYRLTERDGFFYIENDIHILGRTNDKMYAERYLDHVNKYGPPKNA